MQRSFGFLLLLVFLFSVFTPSSANALSYGKTKILQKEAKGKNDQDNFVLEEELDEDTDDDISLNFVDLFHSYTLFFHSLYPDATSSPDRYTCVQAQSLPLFLAIRILRI